MKYTKEKQQKQFSCLITIIKAEKSPKYLLKYIIKLPKKYERAFQSTNSAVLPRSPEAQHVDTHGHLNSTSVIRWLCLYVALQHKVRGCNQECAFLSHLA